MEMRVSAASAAGLAPAAGLPRGFYSRFWLRVLRPVDAAWLVALRVAYGLILSVSLLRFIAYGWIDRFFVEPSFHFKYWGFDWVGMLPPALLHALFWGLAGLGLLVACGVWFRLSAFLLWLGFTYVQLLDVANYLNHYYLASLLGLLLALSPAGLSRRAPSPAALSPAEGRGRTVPAGWLYLMRFQVGVVYVYAGLAKLHADWLLEGQPLGIWLSSRLDFPVLGALFRSSQAPLLLSWAGFLFDTTIVLWLSWRRSRPYAYALLLVFHALTSVLFPIGMFPVIMSAAALVFFAPDWPRQLLAQGAALLGALRRPGSERGVVRRAWRGPLAVSAAAAPLTDREPPRTPSARAHWLAALALGYCALQAVLPLRFALYGDNVRWHEQGMRFSWRVMVREKNGSVTFRVTSLPSKRVFEVSPRRYLTPLQEREMAGQPDLIAQLARHIRADFERRGLGPVEVRVDAWVSLNGRRARRLIDPAVDLARVGSGLAPAAWILPAPAERAPLLSRGQG